MKTTRCQMRASTIKTYTSHVDGSRLQLKFKSQYTLGKLKKRNKNFGVGVLKRRKSKSLTLINQVFCWSWNVLFHVPFETYSLLRALLVLAYIFIPVMRNCLNFTILSHMKFRKNDVQSLKASYWKCETQVCREKLLNFKSDKDIRETIYHSFWNLRIVRNHPSSHLFILMYLRIVLSW